jgi:hypothetical protein
MTHLIKEVEGEVVEAARHIHGRRLKPTEIIR